MPETAAIHLTNVLTLLPLATPTPKHRQRSTHCCIGYFASGGERLAEHQVSWLIERTEEVIYNSSKHANG